MTIHDRTLATVGALKGRHQLSRHTGLLVGDLLPLCDFAGVLLAAYLATLIFAHANQGGAASVSLTGELGRAALAAAVLAPFILCNRAFIAVASGGQSGAFLRCYAARFLMFAGVVAGIGIASRPLETLPHEWLGLWLINTLAITVLARVALVGNLRRLERKGILREAIAVVGAGPLADKLIWHLLRTRGDSFEFLGVFDDDLGREAVNKPNGTIADLIALGQSRSMDWILLAQPDDGGGELAAVVHRLKVLAAPIGQCPSDVGSDAAAAHSRAVVIEPLLPPWFSALIGLSRTALRRVAW